MCLCQDGPIDEERTKTHLKVAAKKFLDLHIFNAI